MSNIVILDNLRSAHNTGNIYRSAYAFGFNEIIHIGTTPNIENTSFKKASRGVEKYINTVYANSIDQAVALIKNKVKLIVSLEIHKQSVLLHNANISYPICVILGNEALGISQKALNLSDVIIEIPVIGNKRSLNVSTAFGIFAFNIAFNYHKK